MAQAPLSHVSAQIVPDEPQRRRNTPGIRSDDQLPIPPMPSGDPNAGMDDMNPTVMLQKRLQSMGLPLTGENMRRLLEANANFNSGGAGDGTVPGLRSDLPSVDAPMPRGNGSPRSSAPPPARWDLTEPDVRWDMPPQPPGLFDARPVLPRVGNMPGPGPGEPMDLPKIPLPEIPGGGGGRPVVPVPNAPTPPPPAAMQAPIPQPPNPLETALNRAVPPEVPQLPAPRPQLALPAPETPRLALPAPEVPAVPRIAAPPPISMRGGVPMRDGLPNFDWAYPPSDPKVGGMPPAPGKQVQGAPIEQTPLSRGVAGGVTGAIRGGARGGIPGAIAGGLQGVAPEILPYIMKNLHLR